MGRLQWTRPEQRHAKQLACSCSACSVACTPGWPAGFTPRKSISAALRPRRFARPLERLSGLGGPGVLEHDEHRSKPPKQNTGGTGCLLEVPSLILGLLCAGTL